MPNWGCPALSDTVIVRRQGRIGHISLNRPRALNALDLGMILAIRTALATWENDPAVEAVVIEGAGDRAFCTGGDIRAIRDAALSGDDAAITAFFTEEYALNLAIARYKKPYIALIDGICMGGGIGLSVHGTMRVVSEAAVLAMPETGIGFFPDVGATFALPRLRGEIGAYLGLTGARVQGADAVYAGLATHFVPRERFATLADEIAADGPAALACAAQPVPDGKLAGIIDQVRCFGAGSVGQIVERLQALSTAWSRETLNMLGHVSPSAVAWTFEALRRGAGLTLEQALRAELSLACRVTQHPDFAEGVRAMLVDKDRAPRWHPATAAEIEPGAISGLLAS